MSPFRRHNMKAGGILSISLTGTSSSATDPDKTLNRGLRGFKRISEAILLFICDIRNAMGEIHRGLRRFCYAAILVEKSGQDGWLSAKQAK
jgi:hypothetical protein